jgi:hypothetical protein
MAETHVKDAGMLQSATTSGICSRTPSADELAGS